MKYTIENWWSVQLASMMSPTTFKAMGSYDARALLTCSGGYPVDVDEETYDVQILKLVAKQQAVVQAGRHNTTSYLCRNMIALGHLLGYSKEASLWLAFAGYIVNYVSYTLTTRLQALPSHLKHRFRWDLPGIKNGISIRDDVLRRWSGLDLKHLYELQDAGIVTVFKSIPSAGGYLYTTDELVRGVAMAPHYMPVLEAVTSRRRSNKELLKLFLTPMKRSRLHKQDFQHVKHDLVADYLVGAARDKKAHGANVLVYGPPGTGKTEFVRWLSTETGLKFFTATPAADKAADTLKQALTSCTFMKHRQGDVLVVDEAEDVFTSTNYAQVLVPNGDALNKGNLNTFLETHEVPIVWICNQRHIIDPAIRRRCDIVIEIDKLPREARLKAIRRHTHGLQIQASWKEHLSRNDDITMADIGSACRAVKLAGNRTSKVAARAIEEVLQAKLKDRERSPQVLPKVKTTALKYDLQYCNTDLPLDLIQQQLQQGHTGRFCFYGPPGTGKTEFVRHVARQHRRKLIEKPASSLLGMYVGQTEKNIAAAFVEADDQGAILLIDEADSFLRNREGARQSWEVQQVNELLVQMEKFDGTLICCSNLIDNIDPAAFRRFDMKIKFDYMKPQQVQAMLESTVGPLEPSAVRRCSKLRCCTPGDFAAVVRRFSFLDQAPTAVEVLQQLEQEVGFKPENKTNAIGF